MDDIMLNTIVTLVKNAEVFLTTQGFEKIEEVEDSGVVVDIKMKNSKDEIVRITTKTLEDFLEQDEYVISVKMENYEYKFMTFGVFSVDTLVSIGLTNKRSLNLLEITPYKLEDILKYVVPMKYYRTLNEPFRYEIDNIVTFASPIRSLYYVSFIEVRYTYAIEKDLTSMRDIGG